MWKSLSHFASLSALFLVSPISAQFFGVGGKLWPQKQIRSHYLQERAVQAAFAARAAYKDNMVAVEQSFRQAFKDPEVLERYGQDMEEWSKMTAEEQKVLLTKTFKGSSQEDMLVDMLINKEDVIQCMETSGDVPPEELIRCKTDDAYFELKMREMCEATQQAYNSSNFLKRLRNAMNRVFQDPEETLNQYEWNMEDVSKVTPEEMQAQMIQAMKRWSQEDMLAALLKNKESYIQCIETSGDVPPEELFRYKTDDAYFELKMRGSCETIEQAFNNPDLLKRFTNEIKPSTCQTRDDIMLEQYEQALEEWSKMTAEEQQAQMDETLKRLSQEELLVDMLRHKEVVIQGMEASGDVLPEELARYETDDAYFESSMRETCEDMRQMLNNPDYLRLYHHICRKSFARP